MVQIGWIMQCRAWDTVSHWLDLLKVLRIHNKINKTQPPLRASVSPGRIQQTISPLLTVCSRQSTRVYFYTRYFALHHAWHCLYWAHSPSSPPLPFRCPEQPRGPLKLYTTTELFFPSGLRWAQRPRSAVVKAAELSRMEDIRCRPSLYGCYWNTEDKTINWTETGFQLTAIKC